ncbi:MAG: hypothetical protein K2I20_02220 [Clostridia bacterium]|nr:hypothetical protein [Clostridia bacterium]
MLMVDWIALAILVVFAAIGALVGFGKGLKFLTGGIFGIIISVVLCYIFGSMILGIPFVNDLLTKLAEAIGGWSIAVTVIYYIVLFVLFTLIRILIVKIIRKVAEADVLVMKIINRVLGAVLLAAFGILLGMLALQIIYWVQGGIDGAIYNEWMSFVAEGESEGDQHTPSAIICALYANNPLSALADYFMHLVEMIKGGVEGAALALAG